MYVRVCIYIYMNAGVLPRDQEQLRVHACVAFKKTPCERFRRVPPSITALLKCVDGSSRKVRASVYILQRGVQWKQGVVICMVLYTILLYDTTPIHCTPLRLQPPVINTQSGPMDVNRRATIIRPFENMVGVNMVLAEYH